MKTAKELLGKHLYIHYSKLDMIPISANTLYTDKASLIQIMRTDSAYKLANSRFSYNTDFEGWIHEYERLCTLTLDEIAVEMLIERLRLEEGI